MCLCTISFPRDLVLAQMTLAMAYTSGWYIPNWGAVGFLRYGHRAGCGMLVRPPHLKMRTQPASRVQQQQAPGLHLAAYPDCCTAVRHAHSIGALCQQSRRDVSVALVETRRDVSVARCACRARAARRPAAPRSATTAARPAARRARASAS